MPWLWYDRLLAGWGGQSIKGQRRAPRGFKEAPIREGVVESPWNRWVGGVILGHEVESLRVLREAGGDRREQAAVRRGELAFCPDWDAMPRAAEGPCTSNTAAAQGMRRYWKRAHGNPEMRSFVERSSINGQADRSDPDAPARARPSLALDEPSL